MSKVVSARSFRIIFLCVLGSACSGNAVSPNAPGAAVLQLPELSDNDFRDIASRIFVNETGGQSRYLTYWGAGEDFPSFGIGHFIWFPAGVDAPFDESFPAMFEFVARQGGDVSTPPLWISRLVSMDAPWTDKQSFDAALTSVESIELREWLSNTRSWQARFVARNFAARWQSLELAKTPKQALTQLLNELVRTPDGLFAVLDYFNFKGLGENPRERYDASGWGLVQVLGDVVRSGCAKREAVSSLACFSFAAGGRLRQRVILSPHARNEERWLEGWLRRVDDYIPARDGFVVTPYLQNPNKDSMTVLWFSRRDELGSLSVWSDEPGKASEQRDFESRGVAAPGLYYHTSELEALDGEKPRAGLYRHELVIDGLQAGREYRYAVQQGVAESGGQFRTLSDTADSIRLIVYGDSETEPESTGKHTLWPGLAKATVERRYLVDQTIGYAANLAIIASRKPDLVAIAGDLVESGGEQRDWDEFWRHNKRVAANAPILPALGNHEYYGGPGALGGYSDVASQRAIAKYRSYFVLPRVNIDASPPHEGFYSLRFGAVSLIVLDTNNGIEHRSPNDTNWRLQAAGSAAWDDESGQLGWLRRELARAQQQSAFTFVMFHQAPYSSGVHNQSPGLAPGDDYLSGVPLRDLTPLFLRYGVDAVFNGHDEVYEHSLVRGVEKTANGVDVPHDLHFLVVGIGGDGLRGSFDGVENPQRVFSAHADALEVYDEAGNMVDGGKHYGHLELNIVRDAPGCWRTTIEPVYVFPMHDEVNERPEFERRVYDDVISLSRCAPRAAVP